MLMGLGPPPIKLDEKAEDYSIDDMRHCIRNQYEAANANLPPGLRFVPDFNSESWTHETLYHEHERVCGMIVPHVASASKSEAD